MSLLWNGDLSTLNASQYGAVEYSGTFDGTPPVNQRVIVAQYVDGKSPRGAGMMKTLIKPGDQYGSSSGERTLLRQYEPIKSRSNGYDSAYATTVMFPPEWPFGSSFDMWCMWEWHGGSPYPSLVNLRPTEDSLICEVNKGTSSVQRQGYPVITALKSKLGIWHDLIVRVRHDKTAGAVEVYHRMVGGDFVRVVNQTNVPTCLNSNYLLIGIYGPAKSYDRWLYHGGAREYSTVDEAMAWLDTLDGGGEPEPVPPDPDAGLEEQLEEMKRQRDAALVVLGNTKDQLAEVNTILGSSSSVTAYEASKQTIADADALLSDVE